MRRSAPCRFLFLLALILPLLLAGSTYPDTVGAQSTPTYYLQIRAIDYPAEVPINFTFRITVTVNYSLPVLSGYSAYPASWWITARLYNSTGNEEGPSPQSLLATAEIEEVSNSGSYVFHLTSQAPGYPTTIRFSVYTMYQPVPPPINSYQASGPTATEWGYTHAPGSNAEITINVVQNAPIYLSTNKPHVPITIDGYQQLETDGSGRLTVKLAVLRWHFIAVPAVLSIGDGAREVFVSWQNASNSTLWSLFLRSPTWLNATYKTQFLLTVNGNEGSSWYDEGSYAEVGAVSERQANGIRGLVGFKEVFEGWSGDVQSKSTTIRLLMNAPHQINAEWAIEYRPGSIKILLTIVVLLTLLIGLSLLAAKSRRKARNASGTHTTT